MDSVWCSKDLRHLESMNERNEDEQLEEQQDEIASERRLWIGYEIFNTHATVSTE